MDPPTITCREGERETRHTHFDVREEAETLKNVASDSEATALASRVFPVPGGPKSSRPAKILSPYTFWSRNVVQTARHVIVKFIS